jgi:hypothetical protein
MATIPDTCEFQAGVDQVRLTTQTNGDQIAIKNVHLGKANAAALAYLINKTDNHLKIEIKEA